MVLFLELCLSGLNINICLHLIGKNGTKGYLSTYFRKMHLDVLRGSYTGKQGPKYTATGKTPICNMLE